MWSRHLLFAVLAMLISCTKPSAPEPTSWSIIDMSREPSDVLLPMALWDEIEKNHHGLHPTNFDPRGTLEGQGPVKFYTSLPMVVEITASHPDTFEHPNYRLVYQDGGGTLDLARFVRAGSVGSLRLSVALPQEYETARRKVFFLSQSPQRDLDGKTFGSGCNVFVDVTSFFEKSMKDGGLELFLKDERHLSAFGGTFFLMASKASQLFLAHLRLTDSRYPERSCDP